MPDSRNPLHNYMHHGCQVSTKVFSNQRVSVATSKIFFLSAIVAPDPRKMFMLNCCQIQGILFASWLPGPEMVFSYQGDTAVRSQEGFSSNCNCCRIPARYFVAKSWLVSHSVWERAEGEISFTIYLYVWLHNTREHKHTSGTRRHLTPFVMNEN